MSPYIAWVILGALVVALAYYVTRIARSEEEDSLHDTGLAILEFGRAFPREAIRSLNATADGNAIFVRLHDGKAGFMRNHRAHYACFLIKPGRVRITPLPDATGFAAEFLDSPTQNGSFVFATPEEAAEVSLWLLDNYVTVPAGDLHPAAASLSRAPASENNP